MPQSTRTFRIFISSTFSDLKAERNALQEKVFPRLRDLAASYGCRFQAIDLRWGVSEEAALDQQTMKICLGEITRCQKTSPRPNFIVLLGDRYGWQPIPHEIPADELGKIIPLVPVQDKALLEQWYRRDDNAIPPTYLLQPRSSKYTDPNLWEKLEAELRLILRGAVRKITLPPEATLKYMASATEQEIAAGALKVDDAEKHVFCFFREIEGMPQDESTLQFRETDKDANQKQLDLKERLRERLTRNIHEYKANWQGNTPSQKHLDPLCEDVYAELSRVILAEIEQIEAVDPLDKEVSSHAVFGRDRARVFIGRVEALKAIEAYISKNVPHPLTIWGYSGSGKSALMAKAVELTSKSGQELVYRFIGATPESSNVRALLESLCRQISQLYSVNESYTPAEYKDLIEEFSKRLHYAKPERPLILFLDALDQLSDTNNGRSLDWLPVDLPPDVSLIVSTLPGECLQAMERKVPAQDRLELLPMSVSDGQSILDTWFDGIHRKLQKDQKKYLLDKFKYCGLPLYLKLAFEEAKLWKSYDPLPNPELSGDIPGVLRDFFNRLSQESNHGRKMVSHSLGYLAAAKNGLSEDELLDLLSMDADVLKDFHERSPRSPDVERLPVVVWSRLYFDLELYLIDRIADEATLLSFFHTTTIKAAVKEQYLSGDDEHNRHLALANYFCKQPLQIENKDEKIPNLRKLSEQVHNLSYAELWEQAADALADPHWIQTCVQAGRIYDLSQVVQEALKGCKQPEWIAVLRSLYQAIHQEAWRFAENPQLDLIACQMEYHLSDFSGQNGQELLDRLERLCHKEEIPILRLLSRHREIYHPILSEHASTISFAKVSEDGDYAASVDTNGVIQGFNPKTGERLWSDRLFAVLWVSNVVNVNGVHPTEKRWTRANKMLISGGKDPNLWIYANERDNTSRSSEDVTHLIILHLRDGKEKQRYVFRKVWKRTGLDDDDTYPFEMIVSPDGERVLIKGVDATYSLPDEEKQNLSGIDPGLVLDSQSGTILVDESKRLFELGEDLLAYDGARVAYRKNHALWIENLINHTAMCYGSISDNVSSSAFTLDKHTLVFQATPRQLILVEGQGSTSSQLTLDIPENIEHWHINGRWLACLAAGHMHVYDLSSIEQHLSLDVGSMERILPTNQPGLILLENSRELLCVDLDQGETINVDPQFHRSLCGFVKVSGTGWLGLVEQHNRLISLTMDDLKKSGDPDEWVFRPSQKPVCKLAPGLMGLLEKAPIAFSPDTNFAASIQENQTVIVYERSSKKIVQRLACRREIDHCRFEPNNRLLLWGGGWVQIINQKSGKTAFEIFSNDAGDLPPVYSHPLLFRDMGWEKGIYVTHIPSGMTIRRLQLKGELSEWFYYHQWRLLITKSEEEWVWSTRLPSLLLGGLTSFLVRLFRNVFFMKSSPSGGNIAKKCDGWEQPVFSTDGRYLNQEYTGRITGPWLKEQEDQVRMWIEGSSQKPGSSSSPIEQTALSLDGRVACLVENTGRLVCCEVDEPQHTQVFCSQPLKHVWVDECGDLIFVQDDKNSFYAFEWIGGKVK